MEVLKFSENYENPLVIARKLGASIAGELGEKTFEELELAFVNSLLPKFANNPLIRMKQHVLLYWSQSYQKSTLINEFSKCLPETIKQLSITSNSPETLFGSINDKNEIIYPLFTNIDIAQITELSTFIAGRNREDIVNTMNRVLENETVERQLLKFGRREISEEEFSKACKKGVLYDSELGQLVHKPKVSVFAASRPLNNRTYTYLKQSGFLYRFHIIQKELTNKDVENYLKTNYIPNVSLCEPLATLNDKMKSVKIRKIETPKGQPSIDLISNLIETVKEHTKGTKLQIKNILDVRTKGDLFRELAAYATIRTLFENDFKNTDQIQYTEEDMEFILDGIDHFVEAKLNPLFTEDFSKAVDKTKTIDRVKRNILEFLLYDLDKSRNEIDVFVHVKMKVCKATISNALKELLNNGKIISPKFGFYRKAPLREG